MPDPQTSIINMELTKPLTRLIETVSAGIGAVYEPTKIIKIAKAQAEAEIIKFKAEIAKTELAERAKQRLFHLEMKRQLNIESIVQKASQILPDSVPEKPVDDDWSSQFFEGCKDISDEQVQLLWAKILSGEIASPGSYKIKTLQVLKTVDKNDAQAFSKLCQTCWMIGGRPMPIVYDANAGYLDHVGLTFEDAVQLENIGLISMTTVGGYSLKRQPERIILQYGVRYILKLPSTINDFPLGSILLTQAGQQIARNITSYCNDSYLEAVIREWNNKEIIASIPIEDGKIFKRK
jgi:hypothetical protein